MDRDPQLRESLEPRCTKEPAAPKTIYVRPLVEGRYVQVFGRPCMAYSTKGTMHLHYTCACRLSWRGHRQMPSTVIQPIIPIPALLPCRGFVNDTPGEGV